MMILMSIVNDDAYIDVDVSVLWWEKYVRGCTKMSAVFIVHDDRDWSMNQ